MNFLKKMAHLVSAILLLTALVHLTSGQGGQVCHHIDALDAMYMVQCYDVNATNVWQVSLVLDDLKLRESYARIRVEVSNSDGSVLPDGVFAGYKIVSVIMNNCGFKSIPFRLIDTLPDYLFNLDLGQNEISDIDVDQLNALPFAQSLLTFRLFSNKIVSLPEDAFVNLTNLTKLDLKDNLIEEVVDNTFRGLEKLKGLYLYENQLKRVDKDAFATLEKLHFLGLDINEMTFLEEGTISVQNQTNLKEVALEGNPFHCNCSLQWLKEYLVSINYLESSGATCVYPQIGSFAEIDFCPSEGEISGENFNSNEIFEKSQKTLKHDTDLFLNN